MWIPSYCRALIRILLNVLFMLESIPHSPAADMVSVAFDKSRICKNLQDCSDISGDVWCHPDLRQCLCKKGSVPLTYNEKSKCIPAAGIGEECDVSEQCFENDPHSTCVISDALSLVCQCQLGYREDDIDGRIQCVDVQRPSFHGIGLRFDNRDTVPIVMSCLSAGLALIACCAGIIQLLRKKRANHTRRTEEPHIPQETDVLSGSTPFNNMFCHHSAFPHLRLPPGHCPPPYSVSQYSAVGSNQLSGTDGAVQDLPPSYDEAIRHSSSPTDDISDKA